MYKNIFQETILRLCILRETGLSTLHRIFAFMTYLNDVEDGGTTDFDHYGLKIKPEKK